MAEITLQADTGRPLGSGPARRLRAEGRIPGVVYGLGAEPVAVAVDWKPLRAALTTEAGLNALIDLSVGDETALCVVKELQRHPIRNEVLHIDFLRVSADVAITVDVPIVIEGDAEEVYRNDGTVDHVLFTLAVNAKPGDIPNELVVDVSRLTIGDAVRVSDLPLPSGVTTDVDPEEAVVLAQVSAAAIEAEAIAEADAELAAEQSAEGAPEGEAAADGEADGGAAETGDAGEGGDEG
ncbi:MAG: 50S ribosomal protein L25 [Acidimicrobiales bacterium]